MIPLAANATETLQRRFPILLNGPDNAQKLPLISGESAPNLIHVSVGPPVFLQNGMSIGLAIFAQRTVVSHYFKRASTFSPQNCPFPLGDRVRIYTWYLKTTRVINSNGISIGSTISYESQMLCCIMHCECERKPPKLPLFLGILSPARGGSSHGDKQHAPKN